ncbi:MAG: FAD-dependent oxidoreductase [Gemmatimonadaceae bacterium]
MSSEAAPPSGPDLVSEGLAIAGLADGARVLGHADGEAVLVVRQGDDIFAVAASCTHYGGPLAEGLVVGDTVRCPWHHAAFSLRTGEAVRAPALNPLACWTTERRGDRLHVTGKRERDPLAPTADELAAIGGDVPSSVVIIGAGAAGSAAAELLRRRAYAGPITIIDAEDGSPYDRPNLSKDYLAGEAEEEWIPLRPEGFYDEHDIRIIRSKVASLDTDGRTVRLADGSSHPYGALLLATGADPRAIDIPGHDLPHVHLLRSLTDSSAIIALAEQAKRAVVMGASFIGLEVAASLRTRGLDVHVVAPESQPLERVLGPELGAMVRAIHEEHGVIFHLGQTAGSIERDAVVLESGERLPADVVVVGIGVIPRLDLASAAGLEMDRGVVVDEQLRTSAPGVYAAGDIARWPDPHSGGRIRVEHWVVAQRQGQTAARNMLGAGERFDAVPFFWSKHYDVSIRYSGHAEKWDTIDVSGDVAARDCSVAFRRGGKTLAVASVRRDLENLEAAAAIERGDEEALHRIVGG